MISVYAPSVVKHWGDWIVTLWIAELLKKNNEEVQIEFNDLHIQSQTREWLKFPWANRIVRKPLKLAQQQYDYVLATHHRHSFKRTLYPDLDGGKLLYFDAHGIVYKMVTENFYPTFVPSDRLEQEYNDLKLPERYDVVHLNDIDPSVDGRHDKPLAQYLKNSSIIDENKPTVSTSFHVPGTLNMSHIPAWLKLYVMIKSDSFWCSYTGFTSIASIYRCRNKSFIVNEAGPERITVTEYLPGPVRLVPGPAVPGPERLVPVPGPERILRVTVTERGPVVTDTHATAASERRQELTVTPPPPVERPGWAVGAGLQLLPGKRLELALERPPAVRPSTRRRLRPRATGSRRGPAQRRTGRGWA
jgi:hypothetical protein